MVVSHCWVMGRQIPTPSSAFGHQTGCEAPPHSAFTTRQSILSRLSSPQALAAADASKPE